MEARRFGEPPYPGVPELLSSVVQRTEGETEWAAMQRIAPLLGIGTAETLRVGAPQVDAVGP